MADRTSNVQQAYVQSLRELRKGIGCTRDRVNNHPELLAGLQRRLAQQGKPQTVERCIAELKEMIDGFDNPIHGNQLMVAFRFDAEHYKNTISERRKSYINSLLQSDDPEVRKLARDPRTLQRHEDEAIEELARCLAENYAEGLASTAAGYEYSQVAETGEGLAPETSSETYYFSKAGAIVRVDCMVWLRSTNPSGVYQFQSSRQYYNESRKGVLGFEELFGCRIANVVEDFGGGMLAYIEVFESLKPTDDLYPCGYRINVDSKKRSMPIVQLTKIRPQMRRMEFHLVFAGEMTPVRAWWFRTTYNVGGRIEPERHEGRYLDILNEGRYIYAVFDNEGSPLGSHQGIAWRWSDEV
ncbi:MAG TPA: hypothetical protein VGL93_14485 [Streptosporangiaceae bacterium]|jgi:hypothetical protein